MTQLSAFDNSKRFVSVILLLSGFGVYCAFLVFLYSSVGHMDYIPLITWLEIENEDYSKASMITIAILFWCAFFLNIDTYYVFMNNPRMFYLCSTCFTIGLGAIVMQANTLGQWNNKQHENWTYVFCISFIIAIVIYTARSIKLKHMKYTRCGLLISAVSSLITYVIYFYLYREDRSNYYNLTIAALGQNVFLMTSILFYVTSIFELYKISDTDQSPLLNHVILVSE